MQTFNPEIEQDRAVDAFEMFEQHRQVMFHQQMWIYEHLRAQVHHYSVLEAGCGMGLGTAILSQTAKNITGTDKLLKNIQLARCLYPWIHYELWDLNQPTDLRAEVVVAVEAVEHVQNTHDAIRNLIDAASHCIYISTPNGAGKPEPPDNPYHVTEIPPPKMLQMIGNHAVTIRHWENWTELDVNTKVDPLVYCIRK